MKPSSTSCQWESRGLYLVRWVHHRFSVSSLVSVWYPHNCSMPTLYLVLMPLPSQAIGCGISVPSLSTVSVTKRKLFQPFWQVWLLLIWKSSGVNVSQKWFLWFLCHSYPFFQPLSWPTLSLDHLVGGWVKACLLSYWLVWPDHSNGSSALSLVPSMLHSLSLVSTTWPMRSIPSWLRMLVELVSGQWLPSLILLKVQLF